MEVTKAMFSVSPLTITTAVSICMYVAAAVTVTIAIWLLRLMREADVYVGPFGGMEILNISQDQVSYMCSPSLSCHRHQELHCFLLKPVITYS